MLHFESSRYVAVFQPQDINQADCVRCGQGRQCPWQGGEAAIGQPATPVRPAAVIAGDPDIEPKREPQITKPALHLGVGYVLPLRGGYRRVRLCLLTDTVRFMQSMIRHHWTAVGEKPRNASTTPSTRRLSNCVQTSKKCSWPKSAGCRLGWSNGTSFTADGQ